MLKQLLSRMEPIHRAETQEEMRGRVIVASLLRAAYEIFAGEQETDLVFCYCSPGLVRYYQQLAMRPFGGRLVAAPDGLMVPLVAVDDNRRLRTMGRGELFGEGAFLQPDGRRSATARAATDARVLILRGRSVEKLMRRDPALGSSLQDRLTALMAERLGHAAGVAAAA